MDKDTRNAIGDATQQARTLLEDDFASQLEGTFDVLRDGRVALVAGSHLSPRQVFQRDKIVAAIEHKRAAGMSAAEAVVDYVRDAAFTTLNRFVALKMLEARELVQECITKGEQSSGYREFCGMAAGVALLPESAGYRLYIESLFDELSTEVKVLFDRRDPASVLWPRRATFEALLDVLNATELTGVWGEDETIGWTYQFFNSAEDRRRARYDDNGKPKAPRNSRELAVRNQFFTPRYVVEFLTDNTLGRIWCEMRNGHTGLVDRCAYLIAHSEETSTPRLKKDPRDIQVLDPACGSGHFLLYAFDLLIAIYEEAYLDPEGPRSEVTQRTLAADYPDIDALRRAAPGLILAHNLHGVDIDPRCAQIAQLALWIRVQRAYRDIGIVRAARPLIRRSRIVLAEPLVADQETLKAFLADLGDKELGRAFMDLVANLELAGDLGLLLRFEGLVARVPKRDHTGDLFAPTEARIRAALPHFVTASGALAGTRRRLFADDATEGLSLLETAEKRFDVVVMNPPFGEARDNASTLLADLYPEWNKNILCAFVARAMELLNRGGLCGAVVDRTVNEKSTYEQFRRRFLLGSESALQEVADLGWGVLDANVEVSALVLCTPGPEHAFQGADVREVDDKAKRLRDVNARTLMTVRAAKKLPNSVIGYFFQPFVLSMFEALPSLREAGFTFFEGHTLKSNRYFRFAWEISPRSTDHWKKLFNGTEYSRYAYPHHEVVAIGPHSGASADKGTVLRNAAKQEQSGVCFGKRGEFVDAQMLPVGFISTVEGKACLTPSENDGWCLLALMNSRLFQTVINLYTGQHKYSGYVELFPYAGADRLKESGKLARQISAAKMALWARVELSPNFDGLSNTSPSQLAAEVVNAIQEITDLEAELNFSVLEGYGLARNDLACDAIREACTNEPPVSIPFRSTEEYANAEQLVQFAIGRTFGRFAAATDLTSSSDDSSGLGAGGAKTVVDVLVDDASAANDISTKTELLLGAGRNEVLACLGIGELRDYLRASAFRFHVAFYSQSGHNAPLYWQLALPSARYSVWLYLHSFTKDTIYKVQNDHVIPKLAHEERILEALRRELGEHPKAATRTTLAVQEAFVYELRAFVDEVKRIAPLWNPNLDDGVTINFAPLWRLVSHHKPLQHSLKATWEALCGGDYDWAHLAMHLWPERVVPKCVTDRSLAIAHDLENEFWVEGADGKWKARATPLRSVEELVRERSSPAVKAALKSLLDAPTASGRGRTRSRRVAPPDTEGRD